MLHTLGSSRVHGNHGYQQPDKHGRWFVVYIYPRSQLKVKTKMSRMYRDSFYRVNECTRAGDSYHNTHNKLKHTYSRQSYVPILGEKKRNAFQTKNKQFI